jgi:hypothetical protein
MGQPVSKVLFISLFLATSIAACGGGGGTVGGSAAGVTNTLPTLDLKSVDGAQNAATIAGSFLTLTSFTSDRTGDSFNNVSATSEFPCGGDGKLTISLVNPDGKPTVGDSIIFDQVACVAKDSAGMSTGSGSTTQTLSSLSGDLTLASAIFSIGFELKGNATRIFDTTDSGVRYQGQNVGTALGQSNTSHDGKGTPSTVDDIDSVTISSESTSSGTVNGQSVATTTNINNTCSITDENIATCTAASATSKGSSLFLGNFDITVTLVTALVIDSDRVPTAGSFKIQQASDVVTVSFSMVSGVSQARITNAAGNTSTVPWSTLLTLKERVPF